MDTGSSSSSRASSGRGQRRAVWCFFGIFLFAGCAATAHAADDSDANLELTIRQGDTLIGISQQYLANPADWRRLQRTNRIANPRRLTPGPVLRIPLTMLRAEGKRAEVVSVAGSSSKTDADGFGGPFTAPQRFTVINRVIDSGGANLSTSDGSPVRLQ